MPFRCHDVPVDTPSKLSARDVLSEENCCLMTGDSTGRRAPHRLIQDKPHERGDLLKRCHSDE